MAREIKVNIVGDASSYERALKSASSSSNKAAKTAKRLGLAIGGGLAVAGVASIKFAMDFEKSMSQIVGLAGVSEKQVDEWKESLLELAPAVGKTPKELADALYFVASSGVEASKALDVVNKSAQASAAGLGETQVVADAVTSAMNAYEKANLDAAKATDILVQIVREGKGEAAEIAPVLGNILPVASELGVGFEEVGAAMASMTRLGFDAAESATNIQATLSSLLKPSVQAEEAFENIGTSSAKLRKMLDKEGLLGTLEFLQQAFKGNTAEMAKAFPNVRALRGVLSLVGKSAANTEDIFKSFEDTTGSLSEAFGAAAKDTAFKWDQAKASLQAVAITLGSELLPAFTRVLEKAAVFAQWARENPSHVKLAAVAVGALAVALLAASVAQTALNLAVLANPYVAAAVSVVAFYTALYVLYKRFEFVRKHWQLLLIAFGIGPVVVATVVKAIIRHWDSIKPVLQAVGQVALAVFNSIRMVAVPVFNTIRTVVTATITAAKAAFNTLKPVAVAAFNAIAAGIDRVVGPLRTLVGWIQTAVSWVLRLSDAIRSIPTPSLPDRGGGVPFVPGIASGGTIARSGLAVVHRGEQVVPARVVNRGGGNGSGGGRMQLALVAVGPDILRELRELERRSRLGGSLA